MATILFEQSQELKATLSLTRFVSGIDHPFTAPDGVPLAGPFWEDQNGYYTLLANTEYYLLPSTQPIPADEWCISRMKTFVGPFWLDKFGNRSALAASTPLYHDNKIRLTPVTVYIHWSKHAIFYKNLEHVMGDMSSYHTNPAAPALAVLR